MDRSVNIPNKANIIKITPNKKDQLKDISTKIKKLYEDIFYSEEKVMGPEIAIYTVLKGGMSIKDSHQGFQTEKYHFQDSINEYDFQIKENETMYFIEIGNEIMGFAKCIEKMPEEDIGLISELECFQGGSIVYANENLEEVTRKNLKHQKGFSNYKAQGRFMHLSYMESFRKDVNLIPFFLDNIQKNARFEIIETQVHQTKELLAANFQDTKIYEFPKDDISFQVHVWNNPIYKTYFSKSL